MKAKSSPFGRYALPLLVIYVLFFLSSCGVIGADNNYSIAFSPTGVTFGRVSLGTTAAQVATISNPGSNPVTIATATVTGPGFSIRNLSLPLTLNPGTTATFNVLFNPASGGPAAGNVSVTSTLSAKASASLALSGTGLSSAPAVTPAQIAISPAPVSFGSILANTTATQDVSITNTGGTTLTVSQVGLSGNSFAESGPVPPFTIAAGQSQILAINFAPVTAGTYTGSLVVSSDASNAIGSVALSGTATIPSTLTLGISPNSLSFGSVPVGNSATENLVLTATGNSAVTVSSGTASGSGFTISTPTFPVTIPAGQSQQVSIRFAPQSSGSTTGSASFVSNATNSPSLVSLSGTGTIPPTPAQIAVSPGTISFGSILVNTTATQSVIVTNTGGSLLTISQINISGNALTETGPGPPFTIAAGQSQTLMINFAPVSAGSYTGSLVISSDAANNVGPVALSGTATTPSTLTLGVSPNSLSFGNVLVGNSATKNVVVTATGSSAVTISSATASGSGFSVTAPTFPVTIPAGQSQQVSIRFAPQSSGSIASSASFVSNATNSPTVVSLSGTGTTPPQIAVSPGTISLGSIPVDTTATQSVTITNTGGSLLTISQINISGNALTESGPVPPFTIAAGQSQKLNINFAPTVAGNDTGSLVITSDATNSLAPVGISGTATPTPVLILTVSPLTLSFGNVAVGSSTSKNGTLTNTGNSSVTVFSASATGSEFTVTSPIFPVTIAAGGTQQISVSFDPHASGSVTGSATFVSNASNSPTNVSLSGTGTTPVQHSVDLSWNASTSTVVGYRVYRSTQTGGPYTALNSTPDASTTYTDTSVQSGQTYYYVVTAVDSGGNESGYSNQAIAVVP